MQKLNKRGVPFYYCPICKEYVPSKDKHNRKRHSNTNEKGLNEDDR